MIIFVKDHHFVFMVKGHFQKEDGALFQ